MTYAAANRKYFNSISSAYDSKPWFAKVNDQVTRAWESNLAWAGLPPADHEHRPTKLLDYACGTGFMTRVFSPYITSTLAMDISPNMVAEYNARAEADKASSTPARAVTVNLFDKADPSPKEVSGPEWWDFDVATVGFGFHHFEDVVYAASQLKERLRPGGVLLISDFLEGGDYFAGVDGDMDVESKGNHHHHHHHDHQGHGHGHDEHTHSHSHSHDSDTQKHDTDDTSPKFIQKMNDSIVVPHFTIDGVKEFFTTAGFVDIQVKTMEEKVYMEFAGKKMWRTVLLARGRRPEEHEEKKEKSEL